MPRAYRESRRPRGAARYKAACGPHFWDLTALNDFNEQIREYYHRAVDCARQADAQNDPKVKQQFLELKRLWLLLAQRCEFNKT